MGYPHHHVQGPMGSCMDPKFPPGEDYSNGYTNLGISTAGAHQSPDYLPHPHVHHHQTNSFNHQSVANNYGLSHHFYHHNHYPATQNHAVAAAAAPTNNYSNGYYGSYYGSPAVTHNAPIMDLPIQCPPTVEPQNTALGLQELGELELTN